MRIESLRLKLDAKFRKLERVRFDPGYVLHRRIFLQHHRLEFVLLLDQVEPFDDEAGFRGSSPRA